MSQILVIEDDVEFNQVLCKALSKEGYTVQSATNGKQGIHLCNESPADLVITDILMPQGDGVEVITCLRKDFPDVKIIAISGGGQCGTGLDYIRSVQIVCNIDYALVKPFKKDQLFQVIQKLL